MTKRPPFHHGNLRTALLDASMELLDKDGPDGVTIRAAARATNVSHAAPVNHFRDKRALLTSLSIQLFDAVFEEIEKLTPTSEGDPVEMIAATAETLIDYGLKHPNRYHLLWRRDLVDNEDPNLQTSMDRIYDRLIERIQTLPGSNPFDHDTIAIALWSLVHGYVSLRFDGNLEQKTDVVSGKRRKTAIVDVIKKALVS